MGKLLMRFIAYFLIFFGLSYLLSGVAGDVMGFVLLAMILALANMLIRPLLTLVALPFNILTFGIASIFVNMLTMLIADAIVASASVTGFWTMALVSMLVMAADGCIRAVRYAGKKQG
ncbi:MAG: phage holin family protein [Bacillota bacterium]